MKTRKQPPDLFASVAASGQHAPDGAPILTVSELTRQIRTVLEHRFGGVWVTGEVSNARQPGSGHCYFTLKDDAAQISAVLWRTLAAQLRFELRDGLAVLVQGELTVYEPRGQYQIVVRRIEPMGLGALQLAFLQLKEKLEREGLFDPARKRALPFFPRRIALVTSPTGAAVQDMLNVIRRRCPSASVLVCPVRVQGDAAAPEIARMIATVNRLPDVDVMIVGRGGGSLEDLWPFNEEIVARALAASRIPTVSAVGHETDFTISDFVADVRALTPTDAGVRVAPDQAQIMDTLRASAGRLGQALLRRVSEARERLLALARSYAFRRPMDRIRAREQRLDDLAQIIHRAATRRMETERRGLEALGARLESLSPLAVLARGYSLTQRADDGRILRDAAALRPGDVVRTRLHCGAFTAQVLDAAGPEANPPRPPSESHHG